MTHHQKVLAAQRNAKLHIDLQEAGSVCPDTPVRRQGYQSMFLTSGKLSKKGELQVQFDSGRRMWFPADSLWLGDTPPT